MHAAMTSPASPLPWYASRRPFVSASQNSCSTCADGGSHRRAHHRPERGRPVILVDTQDNLAPAAMPIRWN
jgi:hypothetical protein